VSGRQRGRVSGRTERGTGSEAALEHGGAHGADLARLAARHLGRLPGRHALALSLADGSSFRRDAHAPFPAASVIKLPLLVIALGRAEAGTLDLAERVPVASGAAAGGSGLLRHLDPGIAPTWRDLLTLMIVVSDNTATNLVLARLGLDAVNRALPSLGMPLSRMAGPLSVEEARQTPAQRAGQTAVTTAGDVHEMLTCLDDGTLLGSEATAWARATLLRQRHREGVARFLTGDEPRADGLAVGCKGGWLRNVRHDAGIVWDDEGRRLATVVVLSADHPRTRYAVDHPALLATARLARDAVALVRPTVGGAPVPAGRDG
jgi:beta-lactamase class A